MYSKNVRKTSEEESKKRTCIFIKNPTLAQFFFCFCKSSTTWFLRKWNIDSGLFQTINVLKKISELLQMAPLTILNILLTVKVSYFLFLTYLKSSRSATTWKENLPYINYFLCSSFSPTSPAIRMPKWVHVWQQLDNEVSTWFP